MPSNIHEHDDRHQGRNFTNNQSSTSTPSGTGSSDDDILGEDLRNSISNLVKNISKSFILSWYTNLSHDNDDFVTHCEDLIDSSIAKFAELCVTKLDRYRLGQLVSFILHDQILNQNDPQKLQSIDQQISEHEYDICQQAVVRIFGLLASSELRKVVYTPLSYKSSPKRVNARDQNKSAYQKSYRNYGHDSFDEDYVNHDNATTNSTTSALYTLVIAMLTKATFMPIVDIISTPKWLYAAIIWLCKNELEKLSNNPDHGQNDMSENQSDNTAAPSCYSTPQPCNRSANTLPSIVIDRSRSMRSIDLEEGIDSVTPSINFDNPVSDSLKRPLDNIEITSTEEVKSTNSCYVLYCISYDGLCHRHPSLGFDFIPENTESQIIDKRATHSSIRKSNTMSSHMDETHLISQAFDYTTGESSCSSSMSSCRKFYRKKMTIKRRFREFVILQIRLEENPKIRPYLKNIPKPTKLKAATQSIFALPGITNIKLDQSTIKLRQRFLERFLIALNNSPFIANSYEFKEFFSYNVNSTPVNLTKSRSLILQVNLNKVFVDSFRGAIGILKATLPGDFSNLGPCPDEHDPDAWLTELQQSTMKLHVQTRSNNSKMNLERYLDSKLSILSDSPVRQQHQQQHNKSASLGRNLDFMKPPSSSPKYTNYIQMMRNRGGSLRASLAKCNPMNTINNICASAWELTTATSVNSYDNTNTTQQNRMIFTKSSYVTSPTSYDDRSHMDSLSSTNTNTRFQPVDESSRASSAESVYYDAMSEEASLLHNQSLEQQAGAQTQSNSIQICDTLPIASRLIDIIHYSISGNPACSNSFVNFLARSMVGRTIERYVVQILEAALNKPNATFCINGITSSVWDESDEPALDLDNASLDEAVTYLTKLMEASYANRTYIPVGLLRNILSSQARFYLSQLENHNRNKFVIYSFFAHLLDELEQTSNNNNNNSSNPSAKTPN